MAIALEDQRITRRAPRIRAQLSALAYLQVRTALHKWQLVARDPLRRLAWAPYAFSAVWFIGVRLFSLHVHVPESVWRYVAALLPSLIFLLIAMSRAGGGRLYESRAHAHLVGGLGVPVWLMITWQHVRRLPSSLWNVGLFGVLLLPAVFGLGTSRVLETVVAMLLALSLLGGAGLISFSIRLRSVWLGRAWTIAAVAIAAVLALAVLPVLLDLPLAWLKPVVEAAHLSPGGLAVMAAGGSLLAGLALLAMAAAVVGLGIIMSRDLGPDLVEASYRYFALVDSARTSGSAGVNGANMRLREPVQASASTALRGAGVLAWKTWLEFRRAGSGRWRLVTAGSQLVFGAVLGWVWLGLTDSHPSASFKTLLIAGAVLSMVGVGFTSGRQFGPLLRSPLFALNRDSLARRLMALLLTRQATETIGNLATWIGIALVLPAFIPLIAVLVLDGRAVAVGMLGLDLLVFAWLPSATDRTMAMRIIRLSIIAVSVPLGTAFALWAFRTPAPDLVLLLPVPLFLVAGWFFVTSAGRRLEGNGLAVAIAERR